MPQRAPSVVIDRPRQGTTLGEHLPGRAEVVVDDVKQRARLTTGHGTEAIRLIKPVNIAQARQNIAVPEKHLALAAAFLEDPPAKGVIAIAPATLRAIRRDQLVLCVPFKDPGLGAETLARNGAANDAAAGVVFQRDDLAPRVVGDADDARRRGLPVQETLGIRARRREVQVGAVGEALGRAVAIARTGDLAVCVVVVTLFAPAGVGDGQGLIGAGPVVIALDPRALLTGQLADRVPIQRKTLLLSKTHQQADEISYRTCIRACPPIQLFAISRSNF